MTPQIDRFADLDSIVHRWDPRWKIASLALLVLTLAIERPGTREEVLWSRDILPALAGLGIGVVILTASRIPFAFVARRLVAPGIFLLLLAVLFPLVHADKDIKVGFLRLSSTGFRLALLIVLRALSMLVLVFPMFSTARFDRSLKALRRLKAPAPLVQIVFFTYRYLFVCLEQISRIRRAMRVRGFVPGANARTLRALGNSLGVALITSVDRTQRVHAAMRSRGYTGTVAVADDFRTRPSDWLLCSVVVAAAAALVVWRWS